MAKTKQTVKLKAPVQIRFKQLANGNQSIYLDYYTGDVIRKENIATTQIYAKIVDKKKEEAIGLIPNLTD